MTFGYFAPDRRYAYDRSPGGPTREFKAMVKAFHDQGMEVYLDVVYNHTGEGGNWGSNDVTGFVSFGGFDVVEYYQLTDEHYLVDGATGCGNQLNFSHIVTCNLVLDSLTYWLETMGVDGFRFDLAPVLGRTPSSHQREDRGKQKQFFPKHTLLEKIEQLGKKYDAEMIAEAWDSWGYEVGNFPTGWGEWNGRYRDAIRRFLKGDGNTFKFIEQVNGDYCNFNDQGGPQKSIDFIVAHDGFTLMDLVSYNHFGTGTNQEERNPLFIFAAYIAHLRNNHIALKQRRYGDMVLDAGNDVTYLFKKPDGVSDLTADDRCIWFLIDGSAVGDHDFLVLINMYYLPVDFRLPPSSNNYRWLRIIDTAAWAETDYNCWSVDQGTVIADNYKVNGFSIVVCEEIN